MPGFVIQDEALGRPDGSERLAFKITEGHEKSVFVSHQVWRGRSSKRSSQRPRIDQSEVSGRFDATNQVGVGGESSP